MINFSLQMAERAHHRQEANYIPGVDFQERRNHSAIVDSNGVVLRAFGHGKTALDVAREVKNVRYPEEGRITVLRAGGEYTYSDGRGRFVHGANTANAPTDRQPHSSADYQSEETEIEMVARVQVQEVLDRTPHLSVGRQLNSVGLAITDSTDTKSLRLIYVAPPRPSNEEGKRMPIAALHVHQQGQRDIRTYMAVYAPTEAGGPLEFVDWGNALGLNLEQDVIYPLGHAIGMFAAFVEDYAKPVLRTPKSFEKPIFSQITDGLLPPTSEKFRFRYQGPLHPSLAQIGREYNLGHFVLRIPNS